MRLFIAYAAGLLSFLAPCGMFLIPAFFGYAFDTANRRVTATWALLAGFSTLFVPIGLGAYALGAQLALHRRELTWFGGAFMIAAGLVVLSGRTLGARLPHPSLGAKRDPRSLLTIYLVGVSFAFTVAGCSAPLLAISLAMASTAGNALMATLILFSYVVGLGTPLLALAVASDQGKLMERMRWAQKSWSVQLVGRTYELRAADVVAGLALILLGSVFILSQGTFFFEKIAGTGWMLDINAGAAELLSSWR
jgi:cytochrome c-type biogenesis protein